MWSSLGFRESPYNTDPLKARKEDVELLIGRETEAIEFFTNLDTARNGILVLSGAPGVGKTSFFNVQQYLLENGLAPFGPKILAARKLCPVQPRDDVRTLAVRALDSLHKSVEQWCLLNEASIPNETKKIGQWLAGGRSEVVITVLECEGNVGRTVELPKLIDASFETIVDAISAITAEVVTILGFQSAVIAIDNLENFSDEQLGNTLISFRDTLFSTPHLWWVLIGQSGLGSLIQSLDPRVFERITGSGIEVKPIEVEELDTAIAKRVSRFHKIGNGKAPLPIDTHKQLFTASYGEMRFVFKYSNAICVKFVSDLRKVVLETRKSEGKSFEGTFEEALNEVIASDMIENQISHLLAISHLKQIVGSELNGLFLRPKEKLILHAIGDAGKARASDYKDFSIKTMQDFSGNYLTKFYQQNLLVREQEGRAVNYRLRGIALLAHRFNLLK